MDEHTYLIHYGVKGMKWGKHRFRYEDESSTSSSANRNHAESTGRKVRYSLANPSIKRGKQVDTTGPVGRSYGKPKAIISKKYDNRANNLAKTSLKDGAPIKGSKKVPKEKQQLMKRMRPPVKVDKSDYTSSPELRNKAIDAISKINFDWKRWAQESRDAAKAYAKAREKDTVTLDEARNIVAPNPSDIKQAISRFMADLEWNRNGRSETRENLAEYFFYEYGLPMNAALQMIDAYDATKKSFKKSHMKTGHATKD